MAKFRTEFAVDGKWYTNALRFDEAEAAVAEAVGRFRRWTVPVSWRVVTDDVPEKEPYQEGYMDQGVFNAAGETVWIDETKVG